MFKKVFSSIGHCFQNRLGNFGRGLYEFRYRLTVLFKALVANSISEVDPSGQFFYSRPYEYNICVKSFLNVGQQFRRCLRIFLCLLRDAISIRSRNVVLLFFCL